jgi:hypothetical protein
MMTDKDKDPKVPPENTMVPIASQLAAGSADVQKALDQLINFSENVLHEPTCIICSSPYREDLEQTWLTNKSHAEVKKVMKQRANIALSNDIIDNHMLYHVGKGVAELQKIEYADRIRRQLSVTKLTTLDRIELCFAALNERLMGINSITPTGDYSQADIEKIKSAEVTKIMGSFNNLLKLYLTLTGEMQKSGEFIMIPKQAFVAFIKDSLADAKDDKEKQIINNMIEKMKGLSRQA